MFITISGWHFVTEKSRKRFPKHTILMKNSQRGDVSGPTTNRTGPIILIFFEKRYREAEYKSGRPTEADLQDTVLQTSGCTGKLRVQWVRQRTGGCLVCRGIVQKLEKLTIKRSRFSTIEGSHVPTIERSWVARHYLALPTHCTAVFDTSLQKRLPDLSFVDQTNVKSRAFSVKHKLCDFVCVESIGWVWL